MDKYKKVSRLGAGAFGVTYHMKNRKTGEHVAVKCIARDKIDETVRREIMNLRSLNHPNIIGFKEVFLTPTHLSIVMEYSAGGDLFDLIINHGPTSEDEARSFFQQLISGVSYCHSKRVSHRDVKPENIVLDAGKDPQLKIIDFGLSKSSLLHSRPKSTVGTPNYIAPEVISQGEYDGKLADVWSCGATLHVMLEGAYPFQDQVDSNQKIKASRYRIPDDISQDCKHLLSRIFVDDPDMRITIQEIMKHPWFLKNLPTELTEAAQAKYYKIGSPTYSLQSVDEIKRIVDDAKVRPPRPRPTRRSIWGW